jgi:hypothetical protein
VGDLLELSGDGGVDCRVRVAVDQSEETPSM